MWIVLVWKILPVLRGKHVAKLLNLRSIQRVRQLYFYQHYFSVSSCKLEALTCMATLIAHFRVLVCLSVKTSLSAKLLLRKCISPACPFSRKSNSFLYEDSWRLTWRLVLRQWQTRTGKWAIEIDVIPSLQVFPVKPEAHVQLKSLTRSWHVPLFLHVPISQSLISKIRAIIKYVNRKLR